MARIPGLGSDEHSHLRALTEETVEELDEEILGGRTIGEALWAKLRQAEANGEEWARVTIDALGVQGAAGFGRTLLKEQRGTIRLGWNGDVIEVPNRYAIRPRDPDTGKEVGSYTLPLWWELSWPEFEIVLRGLRVQRYRLSRIVSGLERVFILKDRFPQSHTPAEACHLAGKDPQAFEPLEQEEGAA